MAGGRAHPEFAALVGAAGGGDRELPPWIDRPKPRPVVRRVLVAVAVLAVIGCALVFFAARGSALDGTSWELVGWSDPTIDPATFTITASFADGLIGGTAAVNSYSGECAVGGVTFSTGSIARTEMAGPPEAMEAESVYFELLQQAETYELSGDRLEIRGPSGAALLEFDRAE